MWRAPASSPARMVLLSGVMAQLLKGAAVSRVVIGWPVARSHIFRTIVGPANTTSSGTLLSLGRGASARARRTVRPCPPAPSRAGGAPSARAAGPRGSSARDRPRPRGSPSMRTGLRSESPSVPHPRTQLTSVVAGLSSRASSGWTAGRPYARDDSGRNMPPSARTLPVWVSSWWSLPPRAATRTPRPPRAPRPPRPRRAQPRVGAVPGTARGARSPMPGRSRREPPRPSKCPVRAG